VVLLGTFRDQFVEIDLRGIGHRRASHVSEWLMVVADNSPEIARTPAPAAIVVMSASLSTEFQLCFESRRVATADFDVSTEKVAIPGPKRSPWDERDRRMSLRTFIDWSRWQDNERTPAFPDLSVATSHGVDGHSFKAGRGHDPDPAFARYVHEAQQRGLPWGAYWWPEPCLSSPAEQAAFTWATVSAAGPPTLPLDIDVEGHRGDSDHPVAPYRPLTPVEQARWLRAYVDELRRLSRRDRVVIYTADWYWDGKVAPGGVAFDDCDLRVAHHLRGVPPASAGLWEAWIGTAQPDIPAGWTTWTAWQFSAIGNGAGPTFGAESTDLDLNVVREDVWRRWTRPDNLVEVDVALLPVVRAGMRGQPVSIVQSLVNVQLTAAGRAPIAEDGMWSESSTSATRAAVTWFQGRRGLSADGIVGQRTWTALLGAA
jgi:GH25 family lysozyme M1 (1,4-beta-N-acetylmuramidase)